MPTTRVSDLVTIASRLSGISEAEITGNSRMRHTVMVRQAVMHIAITQGVHSTPQIGKCMGGRDHSTAIHGHKTAVERAKRNPEYAYFIERIRQEADAAEPFLGKYGGKVDFRVVQTFRRKEPKPKAPDEVEIPHTTALRPMFDKSIERNDSGLKFHAGIARDSEKLLAAMRAA